MKTTATLILLLSAASTAAAFTIQSTSSASSALYSTAAVAVPPTASTTSWDIRKAVDTELDTVADLLVLKCAFDRSINGEEPGMSHTPGKEISSLYPELPHAQVILATDHEVSSDPIGFATFAFRYHGFGPPLLWLEDIFVNPKIRSKGAGQALMAELAKIAQSNRCTHLGWLADVRNVKTVDFYNRLGAETTGYKGTFHKMQWVPAAWGTE